LHVGTPKNPFDRVAERGIYSGQGAKAMAINITMFSDFI
jgi:hypothetical protein